MKFSMISSLVVASAMLMSTGALAQEMAAPTMIGSQAIAGDEDLAKVQSQCDALNSAQGGSLASESSTTDSPDGASDSSDNTEVANGTDQATTAIDLSLITLEECKTAGLVK